MGLRGVGVDAFSGGLRPVPGGGGAALLGLFIARALVVLRLPVISDLLEGVLQ